MMHYINIDRKRLCGRNNNQVSPILFDAATEEPLQIQFITSNNQLVHLNPTELSGLYLAGNTKPSEPSYDLLFLSKDYTIENDILTFNYSTYTKNFLRKITKRNQEILIEIGQISLEKKTLLLRDYALANPRIFIEGSVPEDVDWSDFYTKEETQELLAQNLSEAKDYADGKDTTTLASANSYTDEQISALDLSQFATDADLQAAKTELDGKINSKQDKITSENKLPYSLISDTPTIPTKTSELTNDSGYQTAQDVQNAISGKADTSALTAHTSDTAIHVTAADKTAWNAKAEVSDIPTDNAQLTNGAGYQTAQDVQNAISGKAETSYVDTELALKQDIIDESNPISGNAVLVTYDPWTGDPEFTAEAAINMAHSEALQAQADAAQANADLQIVSGALDEKQDIIDGNNPLDAAYVRMDLDPYSGGDPDFDVETAVNMVHAEALEAISGLSGKLDNPSGGTAGQVLTKTADGAEWADAQGVDFANESNLNYFNFYYWGLGSVTITLKHDYNYSKTIDLEYSTDKINWTKWNFNESVTLNHYDTIYVRGDNPTGFDDRGLVVFFQASTERKGGLAVKGDIISLIDKTIRLDSLPGNCFHSLFRNMTRLQDASSLYLRSKNPEYKGMFGGCTGLTQAPKEIPALVLGGSCQSMFWGCTSLTTSPHILTDNVRPNYTGTNTVQPFREMFFGCSSLNSVTTNFLFWDQLQPDYYGETGNWLYNVAASGTFYCPYKLDTSVRGPHTIPAGWNVVYTDVPESVLSGAAAATEALTMING